MAIIFSGGRGDATTPVRDLKIAGLTPVRRIAHAVRAAGCTRAFIAADTLQAMAPAALGRDAHGLDVTIVPTGTPLEIQGETSALLVPADLLIDQRILAAMLADPAPRVFAAGPKDQSTRIAKVPMTWLRERAPISLDHGMFVSLIAAAREGAKTIDIRLLDTSMPSHSRAVPMLWQPVTTQAEAKAATDAVLNAAQMGGQDWPGRFIHQPIERWVTARLASTVVTLGQITAASLVISLVSAWLFAQGLFLLALVLALAAGILDGVGGALARAKLAGSPLGRLERGVREVAAYVIYFGMAGYFAGTGYGAAPYIMAGTLALFHVADEVQLAFFRRMSGKSLCDFSPSDRRFRLVEGGRNTQLWTFLPFVLFDAWFVGFCVICAYGVATFFAHQWRFVVAGRRVLDGSKPQR